MPKFIKKQTAVTAYRWDGSLNSAEIMLESRAGNFSIQRSLDRLSKPVYSLEIVFPYRDTPGGEEKKGTVILEKGDWAINLGVQGFAALGEDEFRNAYSPL